MQEVSELLRVPSEYEMVTLGSQAVTWTG